MANSDDAGMIPYNEQNIAPPAFGQKPDVLGWGDLTACANKVRKDGYWKKAVEFINGLPVETTVFIKDTSSIECKHNRKLYEPACAAAKCPRISE